MADAQDIHQIEYRWHQTRDLSPVASSMSQQSTRGWDSRIRAWVRHPNVDEPSESVCYQILPNEAAALAWRYRDRQAAEREDGTRGRPLVSRVLVGHASLLTPDMAIVLCRTGLPAAAGERAGQVMTGAELPAISADELGALVCDTAAGLDREAAREEGLRQIVAAALSDPNTPLAINIRDPLIFRPPGEGTQALLLWGLWRIVRPLLGTVRRGWSFSTFELPLGEVDPRTLPDIVFRLAQSVQTAAPATPRREIKVRPGDPTPLAPGTLPAALAEWLAAEYQETGGDGLGQLIAECGIEQPLHARLAAVYEMLSAKWSPVSVSGPSAPLVPVSAVRDLDREPGRPSAEPDESAMELDHAASVEAPQPAAAEVSQVAGGVPAVADTPPGADTAFPAAGAYPVLTPAWGQREEPGRYGDSLRHAERDQHHEPGRYEESPQSSQGVTGAGDPSHVTTASSWFTRHHPQPDTAQYPDTTLYTGTAQSADAAQYSGYSGAAQHVDAAPQADVTDYANDPRYARDPGYRGAPRYPATPMRDQEPSGERGQQLQASTQPQGDTTEAASVSDLLEMLVAARDTREFQSILLRILAPVTRSDSSDRRKARTLMGDNNCYIPIFGRYQHEPSVDELAAIFTKIVIPDLYRKTVRNEIAEWAYRAERSVIGALLVAAKASSDDAWDEMREILQPVLAALWMDEHDLRAEWDSSLVSPSGRDSGHGFFGRFKRG